MNAVAALRRLPAQVLADGVAQLGAAQLREQPHWSGDDFVDSGDCVIGRGVFD